MDGEMVYRCEITEREAEAIRAVLRAFNRDGVFGTVEAVGENKHHLRAILDRAEPVGSDGQA